MVVSSGLQRFCETWWTRLSDSAKVEHHLFAGEFFDLLGWVGVKGLGSQGALIPEGTASYVMRVGAETAVAAHFVVPGVLAPPGSVVEKGLDFCETTRRLVDATRSVQVDYAFIFDLYRSYLYDAATEELLLYADTPAEFDQGLGPVLPRSEVERGSLEEIRRQPRSYVARQLREWCHRWCAALVGDFRASEEVATLIIDRVLVLRFLLDQEISTQPARQWSQRFAGLLASAGDGDDVQGTGKALTGLFRDLWQDWRADLFADEASDETLEKDAVAVPLLSELRLLSRAKFTIPTILESFNFGEAAEKARVRMIPEDDEEREVYLAKQTPATMGSAQIAIDLADEGYRAIFHWLDKLVELYARLERDHDAKHKRRTALTDDMDLFAWSELNARRPRALYDKLEHAVESGLVVYYTSSRQLRTARLMLYLHLISRCAQGKERLDRFPRVEAALQPRPGMLDSDRKRIFQAADAGNQQDVI